MATFALTSVLSSDFVEESAWGDRVVVHIKESEKDGIVTCAEAVVAKGYDKERLQRDYEAWKAGRESAALSTAKAAKVREINAYDVSDKVNSFTLSYGGASVSYWLPAAQRNQLNTSVTAWKATHEAYTLDLREYGMSVDIPCDTLLAMLAELEAYAVACYNATSRHLAAVGTLASVEEVEAYDYTAGYPEKKVFTF